MRDEMCFWRILTEAGPSLCSKTSTPSSLRISIRQVLARADFAFSFSSLGGNLRSLGALRTHPVVPTPPSYMYGTLKVAVKDNINACT